MPAGKTVSILHGMAQRNTSSVNAKQAKEIFKPFESYKFTRGIPSDLADTIVNWGSLSHFGEAPGLPNIAEELGVEPGAVDVLMPSSSSRILGVARADELTIDTRFGQTSVSIDQVAAIAGPRFGGPQTRLYLRDGHVLIGKLHAKNLRFRDPRPR